ncbi:MAG: DNA repair protein RecO [Candidatus Binataceae bacterium]
MPAEESTPAIVLRARDYSESDRIVTLLTRDMGKLGGIAKGAKASRRRFERKLEPFSHVMLYFRRRPHGQLVFITRAEAAALAPITLDGDLTRIALGIYMLELCDAFASEEAEASAAYHLLLDALLAVSQIRPSTSLRRAFELKILSWAGFGLDFERCRRCSALCGATDTRLFFVIAHGGIVCARCRQNVPEGAYPMSAASAAALARLRALPFHTAAEAESGGNDAALALSRFIGSVLDRRLRSVEFLDSIMPPGARAG